MVSFEIFVKAMPPSLSELKVLPSFCFAFKIPDNVATSNNAISTNSIRILSLEPFLVLFMDTLTCNHGTVLVFKTLQCNIPS